jgi:hypothetical protein
MPPIRPRPVARRRSPLPEPGPAARYPLKISTDRRRLLDADDRPFLVQGDTAWSLIANLPYDDASGLAKKSCKCEIRIKSACNDSIFARP